MSLYDDLGVSRDATDDEIKQAWRRLSSENHPDRFTDETEKHAANERMAKVNAAYTVLSDSEKRQSYDAFGDSDFNLADQVKLTVVQEFNAVVSGPTFAFITDIMQALRESFEHKLNSNSREVEKARKDIARMTKLAKRIHVKEGHSAGTNVFLDLIQKKIQGAENFIQNATRVEAVLKASIEYLDSFEDSGPDSTAVFSDAIDKLFPDTSPNYFIS